MTELKELIKSLVRGYQEPVDFIGLVKAINDHFRRSGGHQRVRNNDVQKAVLELLSNGELIHQYIERQMTVDFPQAF